VYDSSFFHLFSKLSEVLIVFSACQVSTEFLAVPLNKPGGQIGIIPLKNMGRQPTKIPALVNTGEVLDFTFNPFDSHLIAAACDDSYVRVWKIPPGGITEDTSEPTLKLSGQTWQF